MPNEQDLRRKILDVENAVAQQRLEGLEPSGALIDDLHRAARGDISIHDVIKNINKRLRHAEIRESRPVSRS